MSKRRKRIESVLRNRTDVDFATLDRILKDFGFIPKQPKRGSSHYTYRNAETAEKITVAKHNSVNQSTVDAIINILDLKGWVLHENGR